MRAETIWFPAPRITIRAWCLATSRVVNTANARMMILSPGAANRAAAPLSDNSSSVWPSITYVSSRWPVETFSTEIFSNGRIPAARNNLGPMPQLPS